MLDDRALAGLVFADYLQALPKAATTRVAVGGQPKCPPKEYIAALATAFIGTARTLTILDNSTGTADSPGTAPPAVVQIPGASAAVPVFISASGWAGPQGVPGAKVFVSGMLTRFAQQALLQMNPNAGVGTGTGIVSPAINSGLDQAFAGAAIAQLRTAFLGHAVFCRSFDPARGLNPEIEKVLPSFAQAWGTGLKTLTSTISYVGTGASPVPPSSSVNTGRFV
jgi:hypothetical protein